MHVGVGTPSEQALTTLLERLAGEELTYTDVGATAHGALPAGYGHQRRSVLLGGDDRSFRRGQQALREWRAHRHAGATVAPSGAPLVTGTDVIVTLRRGPLYGLAPCRIVSVADDPGRFGFAYGTLPGHPEQGEEAFHVNRSSDGQVTFEVVAFSRPVDPLARLAGPVGRIVQSRVTDRYLEGVRRFAADQG